MEHTLKMNSSHNVLHGLGDLVGMPVRRLEDDELLRGGARFLDDIRVAGERHAVFVRAQCASAVIEKIETEQAVASSGVVSVLTGMELHADGIGGVPWEVLPVAEKNEWRNPIPRGDPSIGRPQPAMALERVGYVGQILPW